MTGQNRRQGHETIIIQTGSGQGIERLCGKGGTHGVKSGQGSSGGRARQKITTCQNYRLVHNEPPQTVAP